MKINIQKLCQEEYGMAYSQPTSDTIRMKRIQRRRSPYQNPSSSRENKLQNKDKNRISSPYQGKFISIKQKQQPHITRITVNKQAKKQHQKLQPTIKFQKFQKLQKQKIINPSQLTNPDAKLRSYSQYRNPQIINQLQQLRKYNKQLLLNQSKLNQSIIQLNNALTQITENLQNQIKLNNNQHNNIVYLQLKITNYQLILSQKQHLIKQKQKSITQLNDKIVFLQKSLRQLQNTAITSIPLQKQLPLQDLSRQIQYSTTIQKLNQRIKYQDIQIQMLKRSKQQLKQQCYMKNQNIKILNKKIKNIFKNTINNHHQIYHKHKNHQCYLQDQQDITLQISIQ